MRSKRYIALLLAAVYLLAAGGPSAVALACRCVPPAESVYGACCPYCVRVVGDMPCVMHESCCGDHHSTDIALYTASSHDSEKFVKRIVASDLPDALAAEPVLTAGGPLPTGCDCVAVRGAGPVAESFVGACGLRAPPVLV